LDRDPDLRQRAPRAAARHIRRIPGEPGIWIVILGDMAAFAILFGVFLHDRGQDPELFRSSQDALRPVYGVINTLILLTASLCVVTAIRAMRGEIAANATRLLGLAIASGLAFCVMKAVEYGEKLASGIVPTTNAFWMYYYASTGLHLFHVVLGLGALAFCYAQSRRDVRSDSQFRLVEGGACFWHMVDLLWIVLFPLLYLVR
jgi:nitric oxide reductase NorE protein